MRERALKMAEIAARINAHLKRFEADPLINVARSTGLKPYYSAGAYYPGGSKLGVTYVSFQGRSLLARDEATAYLAWLDDGHADTHYTMQQSARKKRTR